MNASSSFKGIPLRNISKQLNTEISALIEDVMHSISQLNTFGMISKVQFIFNETIQCENECIMDSNFELNLCHLFGLIFTYGCSMELTHKDHDKIDIIKLFEDENQNNKYKLCKNCLNHLKLCKENGPIQIYYGDDEYDYEYTDYFAQNSKIWKECKQQKEKQKQQKLSRKFEKEPVTKKYEHRLPSLPPYYNKRWKRHILPLLSMSEISEHCNADSCWIVVDDLVFNVTEFLSYHPAASECIIKNSGGIDCKQHFEFHSKNARKLLKKFVIGRVQRDNAIDCCIQ